VGGALAILVLLALIWFFKTHLGLCIRATGDNEAMVRSSSINSSAMKIAGLAVSNGCIALSGGIVAQYQGYADITSGIGILVVGLASVIIGEAFFGKRGVTLGLLSAIVGSVIYRVIISLALSTNVFPTYFLKLISAVIVAVALSIPTVRENMRKRRIRREGKSRA
jgi:putative ABC transport system permease protein